MRPKGQEYADAEDRKRVLTAQDQRTQPFGGERRPVARKIPRDHERQSEEVSETQHIEIGFIDWIDRLDHPFRHQ